MTSGSHRDDSICHADSQCDHLVTDFVDEEERNPRSIELRDPAGTLKGGAYYEYVLDDHGNWTSRTVHVKVSDKQRPILYEEDTRTLLYWPKP